MKRELIRLRLKEILAEKNMSQADLVRLTGLRKAAISQLVNNRYERLQLDHILRIMRCLELEKFDDLLEITEVLEEEEE